MNQMLRVVLPDCRLSCASVKTQRKTDSLNHYSFLHGLEETPARVLGGLGLTVWSAIFSLNIFVCKTNGNCNLPGQADEIRRWGLSKGNLPGTQSARRKCHTQLGAGPQVSVRYSTEAEEPGAGRLQQTVTFEADPGEFPPSAWPLFLPVGASS